MSHTVTKLAPGFAALCEAVQVSSLPFLSMDTAAASKEVIGVLEKVSGLSDDAWAALAPEAQKLFDAAAEKTNNNQDPLSLCILTVEEADALSNPAEEKKAAPTRRTPAKPPAEQPVKSEATGETKTATEAPKGQFGGGARKNPATDWARKYVLANPTAAPADVLKATHEQNFPHPISKGTIDSLVFEMRSALRIIKESGFTLVKS